MGGEALNARRANDLKEVATSFGDSGALGHRVPGTGRTGLLVAVFMTSSYFELRACMGNLQGAELGSRESFMRKRGPETTLSFRGLSGSLLF